MSKRIDQLLSHAGLAKNNSLQHPGLFGACTGYGYTEEKLNEGKSPHRGALKDKPRYLEMLGVVVKQSQNVPSPLKWASMLSLFQTIKNHSIF